MAVNKSTPEVLWAQRSNADVEEKNVVFLTINLPDIDSPSIDLRSDGLTFEAASHGADYALELKFFSEIDTTKSFTDITGRGVFFVLRKKIVQSDYWPRLTKETKKSPFVKTDFDKWVDEDEQENNKEDGPLDLSQLASMSGGSDFNDLSGIQGLQESLSEDLST